MYQIKMPLNSWNPFPECWGWEFIPIWACDLCRTKHNTLLLFLVFCKKVIPSASDSLLFPSLSLIPSYALFYSTRNRLQRSKFKAFSQTFSLPFSVLNRRQTFYLHQKLIFTTPSSKDTRYEYEYPRTDTDYGLVNFSQLCNASKFKAWHRHTISEGIHLRTYKCKYAMAMHKLTSLSLLTLRKVQYI
jgi:hypothetical protein